MSEYGFDTEPLLAFLYTEPGHEEVADHLDAVASGEAKRCLAEVNASELLYLIARIEDEDGNATADSLRTAAVTFVRSPATASHSSARRGRLSAK